jgi:hypothetical protein
MLYKSFTAGGKEYKGRITARKAIELEEVLGKSPLTVFTEVKDELPAMSDLMTIFKYSLFDTDADAYDVYDEFCNDGGDITTLISLLLEIFKVSGLIPKQMPEVDTKGKKTTRKN